nr:spidroin-1-like [Aegilops tauschii subsp. strangulata]
MASSPAQGGAGAGRGRRRRWGEGEAMQGQAPGGAAAVRVGKEAAASERTTPEREQPRGEAGAAPWMLRKEAGHGKQGPEAMAASLGSDKGEGQRGGARAHMLTCVGMRVRQQLGIARAGAGGRGARSRAAGGDGVAGAMFGFSTTITYDLSDTFRTF